MATEVKLPELGENITSATVLDVLVAAGDTVEKDQAVLSLESEKAEFDLPSPAAGKIAEILVKKGDEVEVGQVILRLEESGAARASEPEPSKEAPRRRERDERAAPEEAPPRDEARTDKPQRREQPADRREARAEPREEVPQRVRRPAEAREPDRAAAPRAREAAREADVEDEDQPRSRAAARQADDEGEERTRATDAPRAAKTGGEAARPARKEGAAIAAAPSVRRLARELGVDLGEVATSVRDGRVSAEDVYRHVRSRLALRQKATARAGAKGEGARDYSRWGDVRIEEMSTVRRRTAEQMSLAWSSIPHVTHHDSADIAELDRLRAQFAPRVERAGGKLTITAVLLKVLGSALRRYPKFNASVDMDAARIVYKQFINIGVAVDTERGLLVPVIRNADEKNIVELSLELHELSEGARTRKLRPDALQGATFTVTNLGGIGGTHFSPIINPPEVAVLGVSRAATKPVWIEGKFEPRLMLPAVGHVRPPHHRRRGCRALPALGVRGSRGAVLDGSGGRLGAERKALGRGRRARRRPGGYAAAFSRGRPRPRGHARRPRAQSRRRLPVSRVHSVESAAARRATTRRVACGGAVGREVPEPQIDVAKMRAWKDDVVRKLTEGLGQLSKIRNVSYLRGRGVLTDAHTLHVECIEPHAVDVTFEHLILATGSRPAMPGPLQLESPRVWNSTDALELKSVPRTLLVVGGGYIGLEMATVYAELGTRVTIVEMTGSLLPGVDPDLVRVVARSLERRVAALALDTRVASLGEEEDGVRAVLEKGEEKREERFDAVLVAVGRTPNSSGIGLDSTRVVADERGFVEVDGARRTAEPSIYAIGDLAGEPMLAHKATHEGLIAAEAIAGADAMFEPRAVPAVVFTDPEVAWCGLDEKSATAAGFKPVAARYPWQASGRAATLGRTDGLTKLVVDEESERVLGAFIVATVPAS
jgi:dihydrolipoamide dehydrogenase